VSGTLFLAATPIGNPADSSTRLIEILQTADIVAAEDSRRAVRLLRDLGITAPGKIVSFYDAVEEAKSSELVGAVEAGQTVVVISDAGMPTVSDPGYRIVQHAIRAGVTVRVLPGPSAVLAALAISGLATDRFTFEGFLNRKSGVRVRQLTELQFEPRTMVFFEAPHRLAETITEMAQVFGADRQAVICRELTKTHEEIIRGALSELEIWCSGEILGEITLVVAGASPVDNSDPQHWIALTQERIDLGISVRDAVADVAAELNVPKRDVYDAVINHRKKAD
jgi:16S rRNA (cytidine1402-2'-O)-methyltransferase